MNPCEGVLQKSIVHNGHVYKSLADHDPHSTDVIDENNALRSLDPAWEICPNTPDALHVCETYPWAAYALVLADGNAHFTKLGLTKLGPKEPGPFPFLSGRLRSKGGQYGGYREDHGVGEDLEGVHEALYGYEGFDVLIRRKL
jgi:hypothetical protein